MMPPTYSYKYFKLENLRVIYIRRELWRSSNTTPWSKESAQSRQLEAVFGKDLIIFKAGDTAAPLDNLLLTLPTAKNIIISTYFEYSLMICFQLGLP